MRSKKKVFWLDFNKSSVKRHDMIDTSKLCEFKVNDLVLLYDSKFDKFLGKLRIHWMGLYVIKEIIDGGAVQLVKLIGELFPGKVNGIHLNPYTRGSPIRLADRSTFLALQATERRRGTINYPARELCNARVAHRSEVSWGPRQRKGGCATTWVG